LYVIDYAQKYCRLEELPSLRGVFLGKIAVFNSDTRIWKMNLLEVGRLEKGKTLF
jgi:hypothetical protein